MGERVLARSAPRPPLAGRPLATDRQGLAMGCRLLDPRGPGRSSVPARAPTDARGRRLDTGPGRQQHVRHRLLDLQSESLLLAPWLLGRLPTELGLVFGPLYVDAERLSLQ